MALLVTLVLEITCLLFVVNALWGGKYRRMNQGRVIFAGAICSALTLPYVWFIIPYLVPGYWDYMITAESSAVVVEAFVYVRILSWCYRRAFVVSLICNAVSFCVGLLLFALLAK